VIPTGVKAGGVVFNIQKDPEMTECDGKVNYRTATITIGTGMVFSKEEETLMHEIIEIIDEAHELKLPHRTIMTLGTALHQILVDNDLNFGR
jgi:hypothetical protein